MTILNKYDTSSVQINQRSWKSGSNALSLLAKHRAYKESEVYRASNNKEQVGKRLPMKLFLNQNGENCLSQLAKFKNVEVIEAKLSLSVGIIDAVIVASQMHSKTLKHLSLDFAEMGVYNAESAYRSEPFMSSRQIWQDLEGLKLESLQLKSCPNLPEFCRGNLEKLDRSELKYFNISGSDVLGIGGRDDFMFDLIRFVSSSPNIQYFNHNANSPQLLEGVMAVKPFIYLSPYGADRACDIRVGQLVEEIFKSAINVLPEPVVCHVLDYINIEPLELLGGVNPSLACDYGSAVEQTLGIL